MLMDGMTEELHANPRKIICMRIKELTDRYRDQARQTYMLPTSPSCIRLRHSLLNIYFSNGLRSTILGKLRLVSNCVIISGCLEKD